MNKSKENILLHFGVERYLIKEAERALITQLLPNGAEQMNLTIFEGKDFKIDDVIYAAQSLPAFNDYRFIIIRDADFFDKRKTDADALADFLPELSESTVLLIIEEKIDKRTKLYKQINKIGVVREFAPLSENALRDWAVEFFKQKGAQIPPAVAAYLLRFTAHSMEAVTSEAEKLIAYSQCKPITTNDINAICTKSLESNIFALTAAIAEKRAAQALTIYNDILQQKQSPFMVLTMIARQFRLMLKCKLLAQKNRNNDVIASELGLRGFAVREYLTQGRNFTVDRLTQALRDCLEVELNIKTGKATDEMAVEMLIIRYCV